MKQVVNGYVNDRVFKLNVGFLLATGAGHNHETAFDVPQVRLEDDIDLLYVRGALVLSRTKEGILVQGVLHLGFEDECYRCLQPVQRDMEIDIEELYAYPNPNGAEYMIGEDAILDLVPLLRAEAIIADAQGVLCRPDCKGLCATCGANLNEGDCECEPEIDPRFAKLKALLNDLV